MNKYSEWGKKNIVYFMAFAVGILVPISFLHLIPKSIEMSTFAPVFLLVGFVFMHLLNRFLDLFVCKHDDHCEHKFGLVSAIGIGLHSLIDGVIFTVTFTVSVFTGIVSAIGMVLHELPEGIISFIFLHKSGYSRKKSSAYAFIAAAISTPIGVLISWPFVNTVSQSTLGILLSLSAGALVYVGATHLLPHVEERQGKYSLLALGIGILVAVLITIL